MMAQWTKNLDKDEDKKNFQNSILGSRPVLERLYELLDEEERDLDSSELKEAVYDSPSWSALQAHKNGQRSMIRKIKQLINLDQQKA